MPSMYRKMQVDWAKDLILMDELPYERGGIGWSVGGSREYARKFQVMVKNRYLTAAELSYCPGIPRPYAPYVSMKGDVHDLTCFNYETSATQPDKKDWQRWIVTCKYSNSFEWKNTESPGGPESPDREPPKLTWDFEVVHQPLPADLDGKAFLNSVRMPFTPTPTFEQAFPVLTYTRNELSFDRSIASQYAFALNEDNFLGAVPGQAICLPPRGELTRKGIWEYWVVTYKIRFRDDFDFIRVPLDSFPGTYQNLPIPRSWQPQFLDAGMMELKPIPYAAPIPGLPLLLGGLGAVAGEQPGPILRNHHQVSQPVCLDGQGHAAKQDSVSGNINPVWLKFRVYKTAQLNRILVNETRPKFDGTDSIGQ